MQSSSKTLVELVTAWEACLSEEAASALQRIHDATAAASEDATKKEAEKSARAESQAATAAAAAGNDEFAGMTEANIAKILKKRAEKDAKAAAKRKTKEVKGVWLFGSGTQAMCQILDPFRGQDGTVHLMSTTTGTGTNTAKDAVKFVRTPKFKNRGFFRHRF